MRRSICRLQSGIRLNLRLHKIGFPIQLSLPFLEALLALLLFFDILLIAKNLSSGPGTGAATCTCPRNFLRGQAETLQIVNLVFLFLVRGKQVKTCTENSTKRIATDKSCNRTFERVSKIIEKAHQPTTAT